MPARECQDLSGQPVFSGLALQPRKDGARGPSSSGWRRSWACRRSSSGRRGWSRSRFRRNGLFGRPLLFSFRTFDGGTANRFFAARQPDVEHRVFNCVKPRALGKHPPRKDTLLFTRQLHLVNFDKGCCIGFVSGWPRVADSRRNAQGAKVYGLIDRYLEMLNPPGDLVQSGEYGNLILHGRSHRGHAGEKHRGQAERGQNGTPSRLLCSLALLNVHLVARFSSSERRSSTLFALLNRQDSTCHKTRVSDQ